MRFLSVLGMILLADIAFAELSVDVDQGKVLFDDKGRWSFLNAEGSRIYKGEIGFFSPGWGPRSQSKLKMAAAPAVGDAMPWVWKGVFEERGESCQFVQTVTFENKKLKVSYELQAEDGFTIEKNSQYPFLYVTLPKQFSGSSIRIGSKTVTLPNNNIWGTGNKLYLYKAKSVLNFSDTINQSLWSNKKNSGWDVRVFLKGSRAGSDGRLSGIYKLSFTLSEYKSKTPVSKKISAADRIAEHIKDYRRMLDRPSLRGISYQQGEKLLSLSSDSLKKGNSTLAKQYEEKFSKWAALLSQVYDLHNQIYHLEIFSAFTGYDIDQNVNGIYTELLNELNSSSYVTKGGELAGQARLLLSRIETDVKNKYGYSFLPASQYNPANWIKAFSLMGYVRDKEYLVRREPSPWNVKFKNGASFAFLDASTLAGDYFTDRSWVTTSWCGDDGCFTFSMLSPLILCDDISVLKLKKLSSVIKSITFKDEQLKTVTVLPEEFDKIKNTGRNYLWLQGKDLSILLFLKELPAKVEKNESSIEFVFTGKTRVSVLVVPPEMNQTDVLSEAEFWSRVAVCPPVQAVESFKNRKVTYNYIYDELENDSWNTSPLKIAPVPHLKVLADGTAKFKTSRIMSDYGNYCYIKGSNISFKQPKPKQEPLKGINAYTTQLKDDYCKKLSEKGCQWVRVVIGKKWNKDVDGGYDSLREALTSMNKYGLKALIDPHDFVFEVSTKTGIPKDPAGRGQFVDLWKNIAEISKNFPDIVVGYDLYNELRIFNINAWPDWYSLAEEVVAGIRTVDKDTPIYMSAVDMTNPSGYINAEPFKAEKNIVYSFHFYAPHAFTHQKHTNGFADPEVFYPGWVPVIQWSPNKLYGPQELVWWDRWTIGSVMLPVLKFQIKNNVVFHCGEVAPIGYTKHKVGESARFWTRDSFDWFETYGISWHLWNQGYGMSVPQVKDLVYEHWEATR